MLEIKQVLGGPYPSEDAARQDKGGVLRRMRFCCRGMALREQPRAKKPGIWCRAFPLCEGRILRDAQPNTDQNGQPACNFQLTGEGGQRFYNFTSAHVGERLGVILDNRVQEVANIKERSATPAKSAVAA